MAQNPSSGTTVYTIAGILSSAGSADSTLSLLDADGKEILSFIPPKQYQHVVFCSPDIKQGETYSICINNISVEEVTVSSTITTFSDNTGGMGGSGGGSKAK